MKFTNFIYIAFIFGTLLLINSCSETTSTNDVKNYFPNAVGNYWVYESFTLDTLGNRVESTRTIDSIAITGTTSIFLGRNSDIYTTYPLSGGEKECYYYTENGRFYTNIGNVMPPQLPFPIDYTDAWIVIADPDSASWSIFAQSLTDVDITLAGINGKLNGEFSIKGEKGKKQSMNTGEGQTISVMAQEYKILYSFSGKFTPSALPIPLDLNFTVTNHQWYGENIGLILNRVDPESIKVSFYTYNIIGSESAMLRYHVSQ